MVLVRNQKRFSAGVSKLLATTVIAYTAHYLVHGKEEDKKSSQIGDISDWTKT